jgi:endonuclease YncB( thermonuclease family)
MIRTATVAARLAFVGAGLLVTPLALHAAILQGMVTHVTDGDSLWVRPLAGGDAREIRLQGIDAPEICQPFGREARDALASRALQRQVVVRTRARDAYQRTLARISLGSQDLGAWMVARGYAWSNGWRSSGGPYAREQAQARAAGLGLWRSGRAQPPHEFRKQHGSCK